MAHDGMIAVVDALFQPALLLDGAGRVQHANAAATARFGLQTGGDLPGRAALRRAGRARCPLAAVLAARRAADVPLRAGRRAPRAAPGPRRRRPAPRHARRGGAAGAPAGRSRDLLQTILDSSSDVFIAVQPRAPHRVRQPRVRRAHRPARRPRSIGRNFRDVWKPFAGFPWDELEERVLQRGEVFRLHDVEYPHGLGGGTVWLNLTFSPRRDAAGAIVGSVTTVELPDRAAAAGAAARRVGAALPGALRRRARGPGHHRHRPAPAG